MEKMRPNSSDYGEIGAEWTSRRFFSASIVFIFLGLLLLFTFGPLDKAHATLPNGKLKLHYERWNYSQTPMRLKIALSSDQSEAESVTLSLDRNYAKKVSIRQVEPLPHAIQVTEKGLNFIFLTKDLAGKFIIFQMKPVQIGPLAGKIWIEGEESLHFSQFIYP